MKEKLCSFLIILLALACGLSGCGLSIGSVSMEDHWAAVGQMYQTSTFENECIIPACFPASVPVCIEKLVVWPRMSLNVQMTVPISCTST